MAVARTSYRRRYGHRRVTTAVAVALAILAGAGVAGAGPDPGPASRTSAASSSDATSRRGTLLSAERLYTLASPEDSAAELTASGYDPGAARHGVDAYRLLYRTVDAQGRPTTASGLFTLPRGLHGRLPTVSFAHGTGVHRVDAPSMQRKVFLTGPSVSYASAGFATVAPDYLGMGTGRGTHPWMDVPSETTASLDLLRAARRFAPRTGRTLDRDILVTGFSQGASAALGLGRALQAGEDRHFGLGALAPVSGAYDFGGTQIPALLAGDGELEPRWGMVYAAYTLVAFDRVRDVYDDPDEVFRDPAVAELFDGVHTGPQMLGALPRTLDELLTPYGRDLLAHPKGGLAAGLRVTDRVCKDWKVKAPTRLYMARGDEQATVRNTARCAAAFHAGGSEVSVVDLGAVDHQTSRHLGSNVRATAEVVRWFSTLRTLRPGNAR